MLKENLEGIHDYGRQRHHEKKQCEWKRKLMHDRPTEEAQRDSDDQEDETCGPQTQAHFGAAREQQGSAKNEKAEREWYCGSARRWT